MNPVFKRMVSNHGTYGYVAISMDNEVKICLWNSDFDASGIEWLTSSIARAKEIIKKELK